MPHNNNHRTHHCTWQSSTSIATTNTIVHDNHHAFANLSGQCDGKDFSDHLSGFAATIGQWPCRWRIRHPMMILCMPHAFTICWQLAPGDWARERENSITVDTSLPHESIQYRTIERGGRDARKIEAEEHNNHHIMNHEQHWFVRCVHRSFACSMTEEWETEQEKVGQHADGLHWQRCKRLGGSACWWKYGMWALIG